MQCIMYLPFAVTTLGKCGYRMKTCLLIESKCTYPTLRFSEMKAGSFVKRKARRELLRWFFFLCFRGSANLFLIQVYVLQKYRELKIYNFIVMWKSLFYLISSQYMVKKYIKLKTFIFEKVWNKFKIFTVVKIFHCLHMDVFID